MHFVALLLSCLVVVIARERWLFVPDSFEVAARCNELDFRGSFGGLSVYLAEDSFVLVGAAVQTTPFRDDASLVHVQPAILDPSVFPDYHPLVLLDTLRDLLSVQEEGDQTVLGSQPAPMALAFDATTSIFVSLPHENLQRSLERLAHPYLKLTMVSPRSVEPREGSARRDIGRSRLREIIEGIHFQSVIDRIATSTDAKDLRTIVRHLSAEDGKAPFKTRHSFTHGARLAADWLRKEFEKTGASCYLHHYFTGFSPNVICSYGNGTASDTLPLVIIAAHYDDRGSFGHVRAPGADDDGSGTAMLLNLARTIKSYGLKFPDVEVILAAFSGEEQGLWGSRYFATSLRDQNRDVLFMLQADMIAYRRPGEPLQVAYPPLTHTIPESVWLITNISKLYTPELKWGETSACCSDHQSFDDLAFPAGWVFERAGAIADPKYHNSEDLSDRIGYDWEQLRLISSLVTALLLTVTRFTI